MFRFFNDRSISFKSLFSPAVLIVLLLAAGTNMYLVSHQLEKDVNVLMTDLIADSQIAEDMQEIMFSQRLELKTYIKTSSSDSEAKFRILEKDFTKVLQRAKQAVTSTDRAQMIRHINTSHRDYFKDFNEIVVPNMQIRNQQVKEVLDINGPKIEDLLSAVMYSAKQDRDISAGYQAGIALTNLMLARLYAYKFLVLNSSSVSDRVSNEIALAHSALDTLLSELQNPTRRKQTKQAISLLTDYSGAFQAVVDSINARNQGIAKMDKLGPVIARTSTELNQSVDDSMMVEFKALTEKLNTRQSTFNIFLIIGAIIGCIVAYVVSRAIVAPLMRMHAILKDMALGEGDLTVTLPVESKDEIGRIAGYFNAFLEKLRSTMMTVQSSTDQLASSAEELNVVTSETRKIVENQARETDMVATAVNQMSATIQEVGRNIHMTSEMASNAKAETKNGREIESKALSSITTLSADIENTSRLIEEVGKTSESVNTVMDVITGIADQTNLLALNAAIEAARAGEQGRGFAVVADEVRTLAARTQESTGEIRSTIESLSHNVEEAINSMTKGRNESNLVVGQAKEVDQALNSIGEMIEKIDDMSTQIATASEEQTVVADEISKNISNLRLQAEQSGSSSAQVGDSAGELTRVANELKIQVEQFKVN